MSGDKRLQRLLDGDESAYRELVAELEKPLINFIFRFVGDRAVAEDLFQETFIRLIRSLGTYKPQYSLKTWVFTIAKNLCLDCLKSKKHKGLVSLETKVAEEGKMIQMGDTLESEEDNPQELSEKNEFNKVLDICVKQLPIASREAFILRFYCGLNYDQISDILSISVGTAKFRVHSAIQTLIKKVKKFKLKNPGFV